MPEGAAEKMRYGSRSSPDHCQEAIPGRPLAMAGCQDKLGGALKAD